MSENKKQRKPSPGKPELQVTQKHTFRAHTGVVVEKTAASGLSKKQKFEGIQAKLTSLTETNRQLKRKIFDLYTIFEISRNFNSVLNYESLLDSFILTSLAQVSAAKAAIFLKENGQKEHFVIAKGKGFGHFPSNEQYLDSKDELLVFLTKLNRPVVTDDLINDFKGSHERSILMDFHPGLVVPLIYQTRLSGLLFISDKMSSKEFGLDDIEFLSILANQIAVAIENARLYEAEKAATLQLRSTQQQLVNTERLAALGEMSASVAHEINNPLGIIKNYLLLVRRSIGHNIEASNYADIVGQEIDRIARIVRELLDFHRPIQTDYEVIDVIRILDDVLILMERQFEKVGIEIVRNCDNDIPTLMGSPENIKQVYLNLIINACDAMKSGGRLEIAVSREGKEIVIIFRDTGSGIKPERIPRIFEPFYTTKQAGEGTGLGLSVCYGIIRRHHGSIIYKNTDLGGCFEIRLPIEGEQTLDV